MSQTETSFIWWTDMQLRLKHFHLENVRSVFVVRFFSRLGNLSFRLLPAFCKFFNQFPEALYLLWMSMPYLDQTDSDWAPDLCWPIYDDWVTGGGHGCSCWKDVPVWSGRPIFALLNMWESCLERPQHLVCPDRSFLVATFLSLDCF